MDKQKIIDYILETPGNNNPAVLKTLFDEYGGPEPTGTIEITENGEYDVKEYAKANVNVESGGSGQEKELVEGTVMSYSNSEITKVRNYAFRGCYSLVSISLPNATSVGAGAFQGCSNLISADLEQAQTIGLGAFSECNKLASVNLPQARTITENAFYECMSLPSINLPQATLIGTNTFYGCHSLSVVSLPQVNSIFNYAFTWCTKLLSLYLTNSAICSLVNSNAFNTTPIAGYTEYTGGQYGSIYVPASLYSDYTSAPNWSYFSERFVSI